jgi:hypothetical protein
MRRRRSLFRPFASLLTLALSLTTLGFASKRCESPVLTSFEVTSEFTFADGQGLALATASPHEASFDVEEVFTHPAATPSAPLVIRLVLASEDNNHHAVVSLSMEAPTGPGLRALHALKASACTCVDGSLSTDGQCFDGQTNAPAVCEAIEGTLDVPWLERACTADGFCVPELVLSIDVPAAPGKRFSGHLDAGIFGSIEIVPCTSGSCDNGAHGCNTGNGNLT